MGGRGFGKTRAGAEWVLGQVRKAAAGRPHPSAALRPPPAPPREGMRIALVGATIDEARAVMVEGPSGILACARNREIQRWSPAERRLVFASGAVAHLFSGRSPEQLRGPEHDFAWADELGKWAKAQATWDMLQLGLRRGAWPRAVVTTTPSPEPALLRLLRAAGTVTTGGATHANPHLPARFVAAVEEAYGGTRLGRQEIEGVLLTDREGSLWPRDLIERCRGMPDAASWTRVVVAVDPPASAGGTCGIVAAAVDRSGVGWVLADASVTGCSPDGWAAAVARAAAAWGADRVIAEANQGGNMVESVLKAANRVLPVRLVNASRGKAARAEPVAALFESGRARLGGVFPALEAQLAAFTAGGYAGEGSPDRGDAMVWALWALCLEERGPPRVLTF
ncbi:terminase large subunit domain-containing protein [uncultured Sphingomonas sp.]|uniref:terminase large subunit domain-containing protein n=1 Tax=uncultured Sphingomonas sp. TaxID=158754 RepID=UPI0035CBA3D2